MGWHCAIVCVRVPKRPIQVLKVWFPAQGAPRSDRTFKRCLLEGSLKSLGVYIQWSVEIQTLPPPFLPPSLHLSLPPSFSLSLYLHLDRLCSTCAHLWYASHHRLYNNRSQSQDFHNHEPKQTFLHSEVIFLSYLSQKHKANTLWEAEEKLRGGHKVDWSRLEKCEMKDTMYSSVDRITWQAVGTPDLLGGSPDHGGYKVFYSLVWKL